MSDENQVKTDELFADLAEQQRAVLAKMKRVTLEEAKALTKWIKQEDTEKKKRPEDYRSNS